MRHAVYDIGSNSIKFLVAEISSPDAVPEILVEESRTTRLAEDLIATCELKPAAIERTLEALTELRRLAESLGATGATSRAVATSAVRDSRNRKQFLKAAAAPVALGFPIDLLSGDEEAEAVFRGVRSDPAFRGRDILGIDVGGGSAEWILGQGDRIAQRMSLPLGCVRLRERFIPRYPISPMESALLNETLRNQLEPALVDYPLENREVVGTGGTIAAAAAIDLNLKHYDANAIHRHTLSRQRIEQMIDELGALDLPALEKISGLPPKRADIVVPGLAVFAASLRLLGAEGLTVSIRGLRYGILEEMRLAPI